MKKTILVTGLMILLFMAGCQKENAAKKFDTEYTPDSTGLAILMELKERVPEMDPNEVHVLASADGFELTNQDIIPLFLRSIQVQQVDIAQVPTETITDVIRRMAEQESDRQLLFKEGLARGVKVSDEDIEASLQQIYAGYGGEENFENMIAASGFSLENVREDQYISLTIEGLMDRLVSDDSAVNDEDIQEILDSDKSATVRHILFLTQGKNPDEKAQILKKAESVLEKARRGDDFVALVKEYSEDSGSVEKGGLYEKFPRGRMVPEFEEASFNLPIGSISDIVETNYGYHIIKIIDREKEDRSYDEIKADLAADQGEDKKRQAFVDEAQRLREEHGLQILYGESSE